jgi:hypothetical protein
MAGAKLFFGGLPTGPSVDMIMDAIGIPVKGQTIPYQEIEAAADISYGTSRWKSVTEAWRKRVEREHGLVIGCVPGSFQVNDDTGLVTESRGRLRKALKNAKRSYVVVSLADRAMLTPEDQNRADLQRRLAQKMFEDASAEMKKIVPQIPEPKALRQ